MTGLLGWLFENSVTVAILAVLVAIVCPLLRRRPALQHALWLVLLVKFVTPTLVVWPWSMSDLSPTQRPVATPRLPADDATLLTRAATVERTPHVIDRESTGQTAPPTTAVRLSSDLAPVALPRPTRQVVWLVFGTWLLGAAYVSAKRWQSMHQLWRMTVDASPAPHRLTAQVHELAAEMRVRTLPVFVATEIATPFVLCLMKLRLLWPACLGDDASIYRGVIAHELAHVRRRDHWVRWLELVAGCIWWWNPVFWFVRRRLHESAEIACDAAALSAIGERRREYAELLLELSQATFRPGAAVPLMGVSAVDRRSLKRRLSMLLSEGVSCRTSAFGGVAAMALTVVALPTWSLSQAQQSQPADQSAAQPGLGVAEGDSDGDGLSDFQETHKYRTDPQNWDSDGDGTADGDWQERREYSYTIRSVVKVMRPCNTDVVNDDYQDARVLAETDDYVELEVIHYPFNTNADAIRANANWKDDSAGMHEYLAAGMTTNWDDKMRQDLIAWLKSQGVEPQRLSDKQVVEIVPRLLLNRGQYAYRFGTYFVSFSKGEAQIFPGLEQAFRREKGNTDMPFQKHVQCEVFGKGMYDNKTYGTCTSTAIYLTTCLRALGIPTRMVLGTPVVDGSDPEQISMIEDRVSHDRVRQTLLRGLPRSGFAAHTFNEVYVGGRWVRLNYSRLGQNSYGPDMLGMLTHVHTFNDLSEAGLTETWGWRYGRGERDGIFRHSNPYRASEISDQFGIHCTLENPTPDDAGPGTLTISRAYWFGSSSRPRSIPADAVQQDGSGHLLAHVDHSIEPAELWPMYRSMDKQFVLKAEGHPDVPARAERGYWGTSDLYKRSAIKSEKHPDGPARAERGYRSHEFYIRIGPDDYGKMVPDVTYRLVAPDAGASNWKIGPGVTIVKGSQAAAPAAAVAAAADELRITKAYWFHSPDRPKWIKAEKVPQDGSGHLLVHVDHNIDPTKLRQLYRNADKQFVLKAEGQPDVPARAERGYWGTSEFYVRIPPEDYAKMAAGATYRLVVPDGASSKWNVGPSVTIVKGSKTAAPAPAADELRITKAYWFHSPDRPNWIKAEKIPQDGSGHLLVHVDHNIDPTKLRQLYRNADKQFVFKAEGHPDVPARAERGYWRTSEFYIHIARRDLSKMATGVNYELAVATADSKWSVQPGVNVVRHDEEALTYEPSPSSESRAVIPRRLNLTQAYWADSPAAPAWIRESLSKQRFTARRMLLMHVDEQIDRETLKEFTKVVDREFLLTSEGRPQIRVEAGIGSVSSQGSCHIVIFVPEQRYQQLQRGVSYRVQPLNGRPGYEWAVGADVTVNRQTED